DVGLAQLDVVVLGAAGRVRGLGLDPLVVVVDRDRQRLLGVVLADHVGVEELADLLRLGKLVEQADIGALGELLLDDLVAEIDALVTDVDTWTGNELLDLLLALSAERTLQEVTALSDASHAAPHFPSPSDCDPLSGSAAGPRSTVT